MPRIQITCSPNTERELKRRGNLSAVGSNSLERYFLLLEEARAKLRKTLTPGEIALLMQCHVDGSHPIGDIMAIRGEYQHVNEADFQRYKVDKSDLKIKMANMDDICAAALVDAFERACYAIDRGFPVAPEEVLK